MFTNDATRPSTLPLQDRVSQVEDGLATIAHAGMNIGMSEGSRALAHIDRRVRSFASTALSQTGIGSIASSFGQKVWHEVVELSRGAQDALALGSAAMTVGVRKIDQVADRVFPRGVATVAKSAVRGLPAAVLTTGMLLSTPNLMVRGLLLGTSALISGIQNVGTGIGLGCGTAGVVHIAEGLVTGNASSCIRGGIEAAYGARVWRGLGLMSALKEDAARAVQESLDQPTSAQNRKPR